MSAVKQDADLLSTARQAAILRAPRRRISRVLYERLRYEVQFGKLVPGDELLEAELAQSFGVSRTPVREALAALERDRLISHNGRYLEVRRRSKEEILDLYGVRITLEASAARYAAMRRTDGDLIEIRRARLEAADAPETPDGDRRSATNHVFHQAIWRAAHNECLEDLLDRVQMHLARYPATTLTVPGRWQSSAAEHAAMEEAIMARDEEAAARAAERHFSASRDVRLSLWAQGKA